MAETYIEDGALGTVTSGNTSYEYPDGVTEPSVNEAPSTEVIEEQVEEVSAPVEEVSVEEPAVVTSDEAVEESLTNIEDQQQDFTSLQEQVDKVEEQALGLKDTVSGMTNVPEDSGDYVILEDEDGKSVTFYNPMINRSSIQSYLDRGFSIKESRGQLPALAGTTDEDETSGAAFESSVDEELAGIDDDLDANRAQANVLNKQLIDAIKADYAVRAAKMKDLNRRALEAQRLIGIKTGRQRYAGAIEAAVITAAEAAGLQRLNQLKAEENRLIAEAQRAMLADDYKMLSDKRNRLAKVRDQEMEAWKEQQKLVAERNAEFEDNLRQASRDMAVAGLVAQGVSSPTSLLAALNLNEQGEQIGDFTAKEIAETLKNISNESILKNLTGQSKDFYSYVAAGLIDDTKPLGEQWSDYIDLDQGSDLLSRTDAASFGLPYGTTKLEAFGIIPTKDTSGMDFKVMAKANTVIEAFKTNPRVKDFSSVQNKFGTVVNIVRGGDVSGALDLALIFEFMKSLDPTSVVRESEYDVAASVGTPVEKVLKKIGGYFNKGEFLPEDVKQEFLNITNIKYQMALEQYQLEYQGAANQINMFTGDTDGADYLIDYASIDPSKIYGSYDDLYTNVYTTETDDGKIINLNDPAFTE